MVSADSDHTPDPLFKGLTRPALIFGMPFTVAVPGVALSLMLFIKSHSFELAAVSLGIVWLVGRYMGSKDHHLMAITDIVARRLPSMKYNLKYWGSRTYRQD